MTVIQPSLRPADGYNNKASRLNNWLQDPDNTVREAAGDVLGQFAEHLHSQQSTLTAGDVSSNPMLRVACDAMMEHKKEVQQAGAYALSKVS